MWDVISDILSDKSATVPWQWVGWGRSLIRRVGIPVLGIKNPCYLFGEFVAVAVRKKAETLRAVARGGLGNFRHNGLKISENPC